MATPPRIHVPGNWYHVYCRGQRKQPLYFSPEDRIAHLTSLDHHLNRSGGHIGAFCLMNNHGHFLLQAGDVSLSIVLHDVNSYYGKYFNEKRGTVGHVFQGRPGMKIILDDIYLVTVIQYVHYNPVTAGIVDSPLDYRWSSAGIYSGGGLDWFAFRSWRFPPPLAEVAGRSRGCDPPGDLPEHDLAIGSEAQLTEFGLLAGGNQSPSRRQISRIVDEMLVGSHIRPDELMSRTRSHEAARLRRRVFLECQKAGWNSTEIAQFFKVTLSTVSRACRS